MPAGVDETRWSKARELARERGRDEDWPYVMGIYRRLSCGDGGGVEKKAEDKPQSFHSRINVDERPVAYELSLPNVWKFQSDHADEATEMEVDPAMFAADLEANPWKARSIRRILDDIKSGKSTLTHARRALEADDTPLGLTKLPDGIRSADGSHEYVVLDGYHRLAKALVDGRKLKARLYATEWERKPKDAVGKKSDESPLRRLVELKARSDRRDYGGKAAMFRALVAERPDEFEPDSLSKGMYGVTHVPTGFRFHIPREAAPAAWSDDALWERIGKVAGG